MTHHHFEIEIDAKDNAYVNCSCGQDFYQIGEHLPRALGEHLLEAWDIEIVFPYKFTREKLVMELGAWVLAELDLSGPGQPIST